MGHRVGTVGAPRSEVSPSAGPVPSSRDGRWPQQVSSEVRRILITRVPQPSQAVPSVKLWIRIMAACAGPAPVLPGLAAPLQGKLNCCAASQVERHPGSRGAVTRTAAAL